MPITKHLLQATNTALPRRPGRFLSLIGVDVLALPMLMNGDATGWLAPHFAAEPQ